MQHESLNRRITESLDPPHCIGGTVLVIACATPRKRRWEDLTDEEKQDADGSALQNKISGFRAYGFRDRGIWYNQILGMAL